MQTVSNLGLRRNLTAALSSRIHFLKFPTNAWISTSDAALTGRIFDQYGPFALLRVDRKKQECREDHEMHSTLHHVSAPRSEGDGADKECYREH